MDLQSHITRGITFLQRNTYGRGRGSLGKAEWTHPSLDEAQELIAEKLLADAPCMVSRFGAIEMNVFARSLDIADARPSIVKFLRMIAGKSGPFWWDSAIKDNFHRVAGFFPTTDECLMRFGRQVKQDCAEIDVLASWLPREREAMARFFPAASVISIGRFNPFFADHPWTRALAGKRVLVVLPFENSVRSQYARREKLFANPDVLPAFSLLTYRPVVSHGGENPPFPTWFDALEKMNADIAAIDFDVAIVGAGAYGMSLAAAIKRSGRKAVHFGGATQILFGIRGRRWESMPQYQALFNDFWVRPSADETPVKVQGVEGGCYW